MSESQEEERLPSVMGWLARRAPFLPRPVFAGLLLVPLLVACAGPVPTKVPSGDVAVTGPVGPKRVVAAVVGEYPTVISNFSRTLQGAEAVQASVAAGLSIKDQGSVLYPVLAESVPTIENGLWKLFPDGSMETTWTIRNSAVWHDGVPFTTDDVLFTFDVGRSDVAINFKQNGQDVISGIEAAGPQTFTAHWRAPFIRADILFNNDLEGTGVFFPLPKHLLERALIENKDGFLQLPYWAEDFVGTGPFKLKQFTRGSGLVLAAFDRFVLGRPKIDEFEVRFSGDASGQIATILSGQADMSLGHSLSVEQSAAIEPQWTDGHIDNVGLCSRFALYPQFINPNPTILADVRTRRALISAVDRSQLAESLMAGLVPIAESILDG